MGPVRGVVGLTREGGGAISAVLGVTGGGANSTVGGGGGGGFGVDGGGAGGALGGGGGGVFAITSSSGAGAKKFAFHVPFTGVTSTITPSRSQLPMMDFIADRKGARASP